MAFDILRLDHVVFRVADMDRALDFYTRVLGCREERRVERIGLVQMRAGESMIDLVPLGDRGAPAAPNVDHVALRVEPFDADAIAALLRAEGIEPDPVATRYGADGNGPSIYFRDHDGNAIELKGPPTG